jgi:hypothetical protein
LGLNGFKLGHGRAAGNGGRPQTHSQFAASSRRREKTVCASARGWGLVRAQEQADAPENDAEAGLSMQRNINRKYCAAGGWRGQRFATRRRSYYNTH